MIIHNVPQRSDEWFELRLGNPTASRFSDLISSRALVKDEILSRIAKAKNLIPADLKKLKKDDLIELANTNKVDISKAWEQSVSIDAYANELAAEKFVNDAVDPWLGNIHTEHGVEVEAFALDCYEMQESVTVEQVGFVTDDEGIYGCSPDGLVSADGMVEIKGLLGKNHISKIMEHHISGECPKDYYLQIQGQLFVCEREWCDLILCHDLLPMKVIRVLPDLDLHKIISEQIIEVIKKRDLVVKVLSDLLPK